MKKKLHFCLLKGQWSHVRLLLSVIVAHVLVFADANALEVYHKYYPEYRRVNDGVMSFEQADMESVSYNPNAGRVDVTYDEGLPLEIETSILLATDFVEKRIVTNTPLKVRIEMYHFGDEGVDSKYTTLADTDVCYVYDEESDRCYPTSLYRQTYSGIADEVEYDGVIRLSADEVWGVAHNDNGRREHNIMTYLLRGYMRILGMCSSIEYSDEGAVMTLPSFTTYDDLVFFPYEKGEEKLEGYDYGMPLTILEFEKDVPVSAYEDYFRRQCPVVKSDPNLLCALSNVRDQSGHYGYEYLDYDRGTGPMANAIRTYIMGKNIDENSGQILDAIGWSSVRASGIMEAKAEDLDYRLVNVNNPENTDGVWDARDFDLMTFNLDMKEPMEILSSRIAISYPYIGGSGPEEFLVSETLPCQFRMPDNATIEKMERNVYGDIYGYIEGTVVCKDEDGLIKELPVSYRVSIRLTPEVRSISLIGVEEVSDGREYRLVARTVSMTGLPYGNGYEDASFTLEARPMPDGSWGYLTYARGYLIEESNVEVDEAVFPLTLSYIYNGRSGKDRASIVLNSLEEAAGVDDIVVDAADWDTVEVYTLDGIRVMKGTADTSIDALPSGVYVKVYKSGDCVVDRCKIRK